LICQRCGGRIEDDLQALAGQLSSQPLDANSIATMTSVFQANAKKINELHSKIRETYAIREKGSDERRAWEKAASDFREHYNGLAFPSGLDRQQIRLKKLDPHAIEMAIQFLEADPWFFRSGYIKEEFTRRLKRAKLTGDQIARLNTVILSMVEREGRREFRSFCRLARAIHTPELIAELHDLIESPDEDISRRAEFMMEIINS
jgi:hypothetical protein